MGHWPRREETRYILIGGVKQRVKLLSKSVYYTQVTKSLNIGKLAHYSQTHTHTYIDRKRKTYWFSLRRLVGWHQCVCVCSVMLVSFWFRLMFSDKDQYCRVLCVPLITTPTWWLPDSLFLLAQCSRHSPRLASPPRRWRRRWQSWRPHHCRPRALWPARRFRCPL